MWHKDMFILISSSGNSKNIVNAAKYCNFKNHSNCITLSGFIKKIILYLNLVKSISILKVINIILLE